MHPRPAPARLSTPQNPSAPDGEDGDEKLGLAAAAVLLAVSALSLGGCAAVNWLAA